MTTRAVDDRGYVWVCYRIGEFDPTIEREACGPLDPHPECRWVLETTPDRGGGRWDDTGAPAPLNRDPGAATQVTP